MSNDEKPTDVVEPEAPEGDSAEKKDAKTLSLVSPEHIRAQEQFAVELGIAKQVYASGLFPEKIKSVAQAYVTIKTGAELGVGPMTAMRTINVIKGQASLAATLQIALIRKRKLGTFTYKQGDGFCEMTGTRTDTEESYTVRWDREKVERTGVAYGYDKHGKRVIKHTYKHFEARMMRHRCESELADALFSDVICSIYDPDEIQDIVDADFVETTPGESRTEIVKTAVGLDAKADAEDAPAEEAEEQPEQKEPDNSEPTDDELPK